MTAKKLESIEKKLNGDLILMQSIMDVKIFVKHLVCSYVLYIDLKKNFLSIDKRRVGYSSFVNFFFFKHVK